MELDERSYCFLESGWLKVRRFCLNYNGEGCTALKNMLTKMTSFTYVLLLVKREVPVICPDVYIAPPGIFPSLSSHLRLFHSQMPSNK